jgi:hypothetical protein
MSLWYELLQIASDIHFSDEEDGIVWQFHSSGKYSMQSLYAVINDRCIKQVYTPVMWKISVPSRIHIFLWLVANNKVLTRDNLAKRKTFDDASCLFCLETESVHHLFFGCCIAKLLWSHLSDMSNRIIGADFESVAGLWLCEKKFKALNICSSAILWSLWKMRNLLCFQGGDGWGCRSYTSCVRRCCENGGSSKRRVGCPADELCKRMGTKRSKAAETGIEA